MSSYAPGHFGGIDALGGWSRVLGRLMAGESLSGDEAAIALADIFEGNATSAQIAAFAVGLRMKGETVEEMAGMVRAMLSFAPPVVLPVEVARLVVDTCGTGGDRSSTINVSTIAAFVVAGAGVPVCKHGNRAASSQSGSADVLEALGVAIDLGAEGVALCVAEAGMGFCFAPKFHAASRHAVPTRRELGVPTVFNYLGPLANPARPKRQVVGVSDPRMAEKMLGVLVANGATHAMVVYGSDGLDELTTTGPSTIHQMLDGQATAVTVAPSDFGLAVSDRSSLVGGDAATNASAARRVLDGTHGPQRDIVILNAAAGLVVAGLVPSMVAGVSAAAASIDSGAAAGVLSRLVEVSQSAA